MTLRPPQALLQALCFAILAGTKVVRQIIGAIAPGGGKSKLPVILASILIPTFADKLLWVVPRNSLKTQGEAEFVDVRMPTPRRLRAANGNEPYPDRGTDGYITTYQAIGMSPAAHQEFCRSQRTILFLDEPHHAAEASIWAAGLAPMIDSAVLTVHASGTLSRHDGQKIHGVAYTPEGVVDLKPRQGVEVILYPRGEALRDGNILPVELVTIDGAAEWNSKEGVHRRAESLHRSGDDRGDALFSMLRTEYAFQLIGACMNHWLEHRKEYPAAKMLVVAPDIETAKTYQGWIAARALSEIATSDDDAAADRAIADFRRGVIDILVCVGKCYEGLSVAEVTHIACLTHFRSKEWLEQMQARANRIAEGKRQGWVFGPKDRALIAAWAAIEREDLTPLKVEDDSFGSDAGAPEPDAGEGFGSKAPGIEPLWSAAHGVAQVELDFKPAAPVAPSVAEAILRENIRGMRRIYVDQARAGSVRARATVFDATVRDLFGKPLDHLGVEELTAVWTELRTRLNGKW